MATLEEMMAAIAGMPITPTKGSANAIVIDPKNIVSRPITQPYGLIPSALGGYNPLVLPTQPVNMASGRIAMPVAPTTEVAQPPVTPVVDTGAGVQVAAMPNVSIPNIPIPAAPEMPGGMTVEQAKAMGAALAPNVNIQPLTRQDIIGTENLRDIIGLLPENVKDIVDTRSAIRGQKAAEDAAAVALAKQTQGLDVAQDVMQKAPELQARKDVAVYGAKATERLEAQKQQAERNKALAGFKWDALVKLNTKASTPKDMLEQEVARIKLLAMQPGGEKQITASQANIAGLVKTMSGPDSMQFLQDFTTSIGMLPPELQAKFSGAITPDVMLMLQQNIATMKDVPQMAGGVAMTPPRGK